MNNYFLRVVSKEESLHHTVDFEIYKNEAPFWKVRRFTGRNWFKIETESGSSITLVRTLLFYPLFDIYEDDNKLFRINNRTCKFGDTKIKKDRRGLVYEGNSLVCSLDLQSVGWNNDPAIILKWRHEKPEYEKLVCIYSLLPT